MHVVSDLQQRPRKGRLRIEKMMVHFNDLCSLVQLITFVVHTVTTVRSASETFVNPFMKNSPFALVPSLMYKTRNCNYTASLSIDAFSNVQVSLSPQNVNDIFVDHAIQMRLAIFVAAVTVFLAIVNGLMVEVNFFVFKYRNLYLWKDILSATELLLLAYIFQIASASESPAAVLRNYLVFCGVQSKVYLPFVRSNSLYAFAAVGYFNYFVALWFYLLNALPRYGIMTDEEIQEYKEWLHTRRAAVEQSRALLEEAKKAHARLQLAHSIPAVNELHNVRSYMDQQLSYPLPVNPILLSSVLHPNVINALNNTMSNSNNNNNNNNEFSRSALTPEQQQQLLLLSQLYGNNNNNNNSSAIPRTFVPPSMPPPSQPQVEQLPLQNNDINENNSTSNGANTINMNNNFSSASSAVNMPRRRNTTNKSNNNNNNNNNVSNKSSNVNIRSNRDDNYNDKTKSFTH